MKEFLASLGLPISGICRFDSIRNHLLPFRAAEKIEQKGIKAVIMTAFPYCREDTYSNLARFARVPDYHHTAGEILWRASETLAQHHPNYNFYPFIDNSPIPEVYSAALAGIGIIGENGLLFTPKYGSWVVLGSILTDMNIPTEESPISRCNNCGICAKECPGACIGGNKRKYCASALTQKKGILQAAEVEIIRGGGCAWGCDICQQVCPMNRTTVIAPHECFGSEQQHVPILTNTTDLSDRIYTWRGVETIKRNLSLFEEME